MRPSAMTSTRSQRSGSSSGSDEIDEHRHALRGKLADQAVDLGARADIDAAGRLVEDQHACGRRASQRPITTFCWLPPLQPPDRLLGRLAP